MAVEISIRYDGDLRCTATHGPSGTTIQTDAPLDNQGKGEFFSPSDLLATSLGTCMLTIMGILARRLEINLSGAAAKVVKQMTTTTPRKVAKLTVEISVPAPLDAEQQTRLKNAAMTCPVHHSLSPDVELDIEFKFT